MTAAALLPYPVQSLRAETSSLRTAVSFKEAEPCLKDAVLEAAAGLPKPEPSKPCTFLVHVSVGTCEIALIFSTLGRSLQSQLLVRLSRGVFWAFLRGEAFFLCGTQD